MRSSRSWPRATTILGATFGKPRAKTSCARSMRPDRRSPRSSQQVMLLQRRHTSALRREQPRFGFAHAMSGAGDDRNFVLQTHDRPPLAELRAYPFRIVVCYTRFGSMIEEQMADWTDQVAIVTGSSR